MSRNTEVNTYNIYNDVRREIEKSCPRLDAYTYKYRHHHAPHYAVNDYAFVIESINRNAAYDELQKVVRFDDRQKKPW